MEYNSKKEKKNQDQKRQWAPSLLLNYGTLFWGLGTRQDCLILLITTSVQYYTGNPKSLWQAKKQKKQH